MSKQLAVKEAAECLGVSDKLVYAALRPGKIVHERYGLGRGTIRIAEEALEEYRRQARVEHRRPHPRPAQAPQPSAFGPSGARRGPS